jgi:hypothetical protein
MNQQNVQELSAYTLNMIRLTVIYNTKMLQYLPVFFPGGGGGGGGGAPAKPQRPSTACCTIPGNKKYISY